MNKNNIERMYKNILMEIERIKDNEAIINHNHYFGLDRELLTYIRFLEQENQELKADYGTKTQVERDLLMEKNQELKKQLEELESIVGLSKKRNLINKFNKEYDEEDKKKNPNRSHAEIIPDAEEIYRRYYAMKTQQKEFIECLEKEITDSRAGSSQQYYAQNHLRLYKEIIGDDK